MLLILACTAPKPRPIHPGADTRAVDSAVDWDSGADTGPLTHADVVIVGGGGSGLAAAVTALDAGADVLIIEREAALGGSGTHAGNYFAAGTALQAEVGVVDSPALALEEWSSFTNGGDPSHPWVQNFVRDSAENLAWLGSYGAVFGGLNGEAVGSVRRLHTLVSTDKGHPLDTMAALVGDGAWLETTGTGLVTEGGAVVGVAVEQADGITGWISAGAVVVATGGFARSDARVYAALPALKALPRHSGSRPGTDGSGLDLIESAGGTLENMAHIALYGHSTTDANLGSPEVQLVLGVERGLVVAQGGRRVMNEDDLRTVWGGRAALEHGQLYAIYDANLWDGIGMQGFGYNYDSVEDGRLTADEYAEKVAVAQAGTLAQLGAALSVDGDTLRETVADYNSLLTQGEDTAFGRDVARVAPVQVPPFYALPLAAATGKSFGGAALATDGAVLGADGAPIPGLFAAGEVAGVLGGTHIGMGISGSISGVIYSGRVAGAGAAAFALR